MYKFIMGFISNNTVFGIASILARLEKGDDEENREVRGEEGGCCLLCVWVIWVIRVR